MNKALRLFVNTSKNAFAPLAGVAPAPAPYKEAALRCATKVNVSIIGLVHQAAHYYPLPANERFG